MQRARVIGRAIATAKHPSMQGLRLLVMQVLTGDNRPDGDPLLVVDTLGASIGAVALLTNDGRFARQLVGTDSTPVRYVTIGLEDEPST